MGTGQKPPLVSPLPRSLQIDQMFQIVLLLSCWISALHADDLLRVESEGLENILVNAPATIGIGRPGGHGGGGGGGGHGGQPPKGSWNCCLFAKSYCKLPCYGKLCTQTCTVKCFPFGWVTCDPIPCQEANPWGCIGTTTTATTTTSTTTTTTTTSTRCGSDWLEVGNKCFYFASGPANYLIALT